MRSSTQSAFPTLTMGHNNNNRISTYNPPAGSKLVRETIHSGQFMVSDFEPESEVLDDEYEAGMPIPQDEILALQGEEVVVTKASPQPRLNTMAPTPAIVNSSTSALNSSYGKGGYNNSSMNSATSNYNNNMNNNGMVNLQNQHQQQSLMQQQNQRSNNNILSTSPTTTAVANFNPFNSSISIDGSLTKLFQCMTLAYRQKLTSPKWNRFKGVRLRWKDKIRLNNVIWRCWHMQFILKQKALVCQFAPPSDVDQHNKPEAVVMEGKYWKRKLSTVAAEYKKWRLFYRNKIMGWTHHSVSDLHPVSLDGFDWNKVGSFGGGPISSFVFDDDLLMDFSDTLFSSLSSQAANFPTNRELARVGMAADFIQPGLGQLQPSLDDFMDTLEPLQDYYLNSKFLPPVPEELDSMTSDNLFNSDLLPGFDGTMPKTHAYHHTGSNSHSQHKSSHANASSGNTHLASYYPLISIAPTNTSSSISSNNSRSPQTQVTAERLSPTTTLYSNNNQQQQNNHSQNDIFAVPKTRGKPRGRSRGGGNVIGRTAITTTNSQPIVRQSQEPQTSMAHHHSNHQHQQQQQQQQHQQNLFQNQAAHSQLSNSIINSQPTLLSHLLSNNNAANMTQQQNTTYSSSTYDSKMNLGNMSNLPQIQLAGNTVIDHRSTQQQKPWNPKNANESLNSTMPLNFGMKPMSPLEHDNGMNSGGSSGNLSPPLLAGTPSPPMGPPGPNSPTKPFRPKNDSERVHYKEHRRVSHINAEQKRRCNIKNGFDVLHSLIPQLSHNPNAKVSKAAMLQKGAEYIRQLKLERAQLKQEIEAHKQEVDLLNSSINNCQSLLPATGAPVSRQRTNKMKEMFDQWVRIRTLENWRFWIFSILIRPLLDSYNNAVSTASLDELCRTVLAWIDQHCSLVDLRPAVLNSLRSLCTTTDILTNPSNLPDEAVRAVNRQETKHERHSSSESR